MTKQELNALYYLNIDTKALKLKLAYMKECELPLTTKITGNKILIGGPDIDKIYAHVAKIMELEKAVEENEQKIQEGRKRLEQFTAKIKDRNTRVIVSLRYGEGMSFREIARRGRIPKSTAQRKHDEFMEKEYGKGINQE